MINAAIAVPILAGVLFIVVSFRNGGPTWSVVYILRHAGNTCLSSRYRAGIAPVDRGDDGRTIAWWASRCSVRSESAD